MFFIWLSWIRLHDGSSLCTPTLTAIWIAGGEVIEVVLTLRTLVTHDVGFAEAVTIHTAGRRCERATAHAVTFRLTSTSCLNAWQVTATGWRGTRRQQENQLTYKQAYTVLSWSPQTSARCPGWGTELCCVQTGLCIKCLQLEMPLSKRNTSQVN